MSVIWHILQEQIRHRNLILRLSFYDVKSKYSMHYLGTLWQILNPFIFIGVYWLVFGLGIRGGAPIGETPFFPWLLTGLIPWLFISSTINQGSNSVYSKISLVSKMNFPVSVLPSIIIIGNSISFLILLVITVLILVLNGVYSGIYLLQLPYYLLCMYCLLFGLTLLLSTLTTIIRDVQNMVQSVMRFMMFLLPVLWNVESLPSFVVSILKLNPFFYIIEGFRKSLIGGTWFFQDISYTIYFWSICLVILLIGSSLHVKFRNKFVDYI